jgi:hypothetical protein
MGTWKLSNASSVWLPEQTLQQASVQFSRIFLFSGNLGATLTEELCIIYLTPVARAVWSVMTFNSFQSLQRYTRTSVPATARYVPGTQLPQLGLGIKEIIRLHITDCKKVTEAASWHNTVSTILTKLREYSCLLTT